MKKLKNKKIIMLSFVILVLMSLLLLTITKSAILGNDVEVEVGSDLTYYLKIRYDGKDMNEHVSGIDPIVKVYSDYIYVTDRIPEGLEFKNFITGSKGSVGATNPATGGSCLGSVIDDTDSSLESEKNYHGLHYDEETRTVSFKIRGLEAGCELTVGIVTKTPDSVDDPNTEVIEKRRDFFNIATAREKNYTKQSNMVHAFIKDGDVDLHTVTYAYEGTISDEVPELPPETKYAENTSVGIANSPVVLGYKFSGWKVETQSGTVLPYTSTSFVMPNEDVKLVGSFEKVEGSKVTYKIEGDVPEGYVEPQEKQYYPGEMVNLDSLSKGNIINGYKFLGWETLDVKINDDNAFEMPENDVVITGSFEVATYKVIYKFYDGTPTELESLLPQVKEYVPSTIVSLENINDVAGYHFLGWYKENHFAMPEEDVVIYGEWTKQNGLFSPLIKKEIINKNSSYKVGDEVHYKITITSNESYPIKQVTVKENNSYASFVKECLEEGCTESDLVYNLKSDHIVEIPIIEASSTVILYAKYIITDRDKGQVVNEAQIIGAIADNDYSLDSSKSYKSSASFTLGSKKNLKVCNIVDKGEGVFQYQLTSKDNTFATWFTLVGNECKNLIVDDNEYTITQVPVQDYELVKVSGLISGNGETFTLDGEDNTITFDNKYKKKGFYHSVGRVVNMIKGKKNNP